MTEPVIHDDPFRLRVHKAICACLEGITEANGYAFDMKDRVFRGRDGFGDNDPVPMISILEPPLPIDPLPSPHGSTGSKGDWDLLIQGFAVDDPENPTDPAHHLMAAVKKALVGEKKRLLTNAAGASDPFGMGRGQQINGRGQGNCVTEIVIGPGVVRPPGDGVSNKAYFWLSLTLKIVEDIDNPFL